MRKFLSLATLVVIAAAQTAPPRHVGLQQDGSVLLATGWKLTPAGKQVPVDTLPMASVVSRDGKYLLVLNGGYNPPSISVIDIAAMRELGRTPVPDAWLGLALSPKGDILYVGGGSYASVFEMSFKDGKLTAGRTFAVTPEPKRTWEDFIGDVAVSPDGTMLYAADVFRNALVVINAQSGAVVSRIKTGRRPYRIAFLPGGKSFVVSNWADGTLSHFQTSDNASMGPVRVGPHPTDIVFRVGKTTSDSPDNASDKSYLAKAFVAAANTNKVFSYGISDQGELAPLGSITVSLTLRQPLGMTPSALGLSADNKQLYIACSDANAVAVADVSEDVAHVLGFIPVGHYPTAVRGLPDGRILVLNGKNAPGQNSSGTAEIIDAPDDPKLFAYTQSVSANSPYSDAKLDEPAPAILSNIKHVIYVVKEGAAGERPSPNQKKLALEFVNLDNFHAVGEVGESWSTAAIASDYMQKLLPNSAAGRRKHQDYEGEDPAAAPAAGYIWTNARQASISLRNFGFFVNNRAKPLADGIQVESVRDPVLGPITSPSFRGLDPGYTDMERIKAFQTELSGFSSSGQMPTLILMRMGGQDFDRALGQLVESVSHSKFWTDTAIFVIDGGSSLIISPFVARAIVDSFPYNTLSLLRTIELILGLRPMTQFDAGANPVTGIFRAQATLTPYAALN